MSSFSHFLRFDPLFLRIRYSLYYEYTEIELHVLVFSEAEVFDLGELKHHGIVCREEIINIAREFTVRFVITLAVTPFISFERECFIFFRGDIINKARKLVSRALEIVADLHIVVSF